MKLHCAKLNSFCILTIITTISLLSLIPTTIFADDVDPNLVAWWKFDEGAGKIAYDSSGNDNNITLIIHDGYKTDPYYISTENFLPGVSGYCLQLDGKWKTAYTPHDDILKPAKQMTISLWLKTDTLEKPCFIYYKSDGGSYGASINSITIEGSEGAYKLRFTLNAGGTRRRMDAPIAESQFADNQWHLYTFTYDGSDMKTYRDAVVLAQLNCPGEIGVCGTNSLFLGSLNNYCAGDNPGVVHYDGLIDDLRVYDKALTQQEIEMLMGLSFGASNPTPVHGQKAVLPDTLLSWTPSDHPQSFDIYLGTDAQAVENATTADPQFIANQPVEANSLDPNGLDSGITYYWRVDEVNGLDIIKGHLWTFETAGIVDESLIGWWTFDEESGSTAYDSSANGNDATLTGDFIREDGIISNAITFFGRDDEFAAVPNEEDYDISGSLTLSAWIKVSPYNTDASMYIISKSESYFIYKDMDSDTISFICEGTGRPVTGTMPVTDGNWHHVAGVYDGSNKYIYVDGQLDNYMRSSGSVATNDNPVNIGSDAVWPDNYFEGSIDDARIYNKALSAGDIMNLAGTRFSKAYDPIPQNAVQYVATSQALSWTPGNYAQSHDIYLGTDYQTVYDADTACPEYQGNRTANTFSPTLELNKTYYWRVDEINDTDIWKGDVWSFTTLDVQTDPTLIGYWKLEEKEGFTAYDASGNANHGTLGIHSFWNYSGLYVGSDPNGGVKIENEHPFDITDEITLAAWMLKDTWGGEQSIIGKADTYKLYHDNTSDAYDATRFEITGVGHVTTTTPTAVADTKWHHIAATYDGSTMNIYIDGKLNNTTAASGSIPTNSENLWVGNDPVSHDECSNAYLKEVRVYDRALTAQQIAEIALPMTATEPFPADKVDSTSDANPTLSWKTGKNAETQNIYLSTDYYKVNNADTTSDAFVATISADTNSYSPPPLETGKYYYWRIDQVANQITYKGNIWSFYIPLCPSGDIVEDINGDCLVNLQDYALTAANWTYVQPQEPNDPNDPNDPNAVMTNIEFMSTGSAGDENINLSLNGISVGLKLDDQGYASFTTADDVQYLSSPGQPALPYKTTTVLLPADVDLSTVHAHFKEVIYKSAGNNWKVKPTDPMVTWIDDQQIEIWPQDKTIVDGKDIEIYQNNALWPASEITFTGKGKLRKFNVATIAVPLVRFNPVTGELQRLAMADIQITYDTAAMTQSALMSTPDPTGLKRVNDLAINFDQMVETYGEEMQTLDYGDGPQQGYIIMTTDFIVENSTQLANFIAHKEARNFEVDVVTQDSWGGGSGSTAANNIRQWLKDNWVDDGLSDYVLFIGSPTGELSMRKANYGSYGESPTDFYFATLTGSWDLDGDGNYGEGSSDVSDPYYEVMVGRIPYYDSIADLDHILAKSIDYECQFANQTQWRKNTLSAMKPLNTTYGTSWAFGEDMRRDIFDPAGWPYHRIYDMTHLPAGIIPETTPCSVYTVTDVWSNGKFGSMVYSTHGASTNNAGVMNLDMLPNMNDRYPSMGFAASCSTAHPETSRNLCYSMLLNGCIGICGSTRSSWYSPSQTNFNNSGSCEGQGYEFYERIAQGMTAGKALYELKQQQKFSWWQNNMILTLYGDPSIRVMPIQPGDLNEDGYFDYQDMAILSRRWLEQLN